MEFLFRRVYKLGFDPHGHGHGHSHTHDHGHDQHAGARAEEGRGLLSSQQGGGSNGAAAAGVAVEESHPLPERSPDRHSHSHSSRNGHRRHLDGDEEAGSSSSGYGSLGGNDAPAKKAPHAPSSCKDGCHQSLFTEGEGKEEDAVVVAARHCYHHEEVAHIVTAFQQQNHSLLTAAMMEMGASCRVVSRGVRANGCMHLFFLAKTMHAPYIERVYASFV